MLFADNDRNTQRQKRMEASYFVILTLGAILQAVRNGITTRYHGVRSQQASERTGLSVLLNKRIWTSVGKRGLVLVLSCSDLDPIRSLLALVRINSSNVIMEVVWTVFTYKFDDSDLSRDPFYEVVYEGVFPRRKGV